MIHKAKQIIATKHFQEKFPYFKRWCKSVQVGDIEQMTVFLVQKVR